MRGREGTPHRMNRNPINLGKIQFNFTIVIKHWGGLGSAKIAPGGRKTLPRGRNLWEERGNERKGKIF